MQLKFFWLQILKYKDRCDRNRKSECDIEIPDDRLLEKEMSTWEACLCFR